MPGSVIVGLLRFSVINLFAYWVINTRFAFFDNAPGFSTFRIKSSGNFTGIVIDISHGSYSLSSRAQSVKPCARLFLPKLSDSFVFQGNRRREGLFFMEGRYYTPKVAKGTCGVVVFEWFFAKRLALTLHIDDRRIASTCAIKIQYCFLRYRK